MSSPFGTVDPPVHVLVERGRPHTLWNAGSDTAACVIVLVPPAFAEYFSEVAGANRAEGAAMEVRKQLSARYDIEVVGPTIRPARVSR